MLLCFTCPFSDLPYIWPCVAGKFSNFPFFRSCSQRLLLLFRWDIPVMLYRIIKYTRKIHSNTTCLNKLKQVVFDYILPIYVMTSFTSYSVLLGYSFLFLFRFIFSETFLAFDLVFLNSCLLFYSLFLSSVDVTAVNFNEMLIQLTAVNAKQHFTATQLKECFFPLTL